MVSSIRIGKLDLFKNQTNYSFRYQLLLTFEPFRSFKNSITVCICSQVNLMTHELDMIHDDQAIQAYLHNIFDLFRPELRLEFESVNAVVNSKIAQKLPVQCFKYERFCKHLALNNNF